MEKKSSFQGGVTHGTDTGAYFWIVDDVVKQLGVSKPTAYKLMHESGAMTKTPRRCRVFVPEFIKYLRGGQPQ